MNICMNLPRPINPYAMNPRQLIRAKATTILCEDLTPGPDLPKRLASHSAPVVAFDLLNQRDRYIIINTWLNTGHSQGIQILFMPYTKQRLTIHMVPDMSNMSEASLSPSIYQGSDFPPSR